MKRIITLIAIATISIAGFSKEHLVSRADLMTIINDYRGSQGIDIVNVGAIGTTALKGIIKASLRTEADKDADDIIKMMKGINRITIVDFGDCSKQVKDEMNLRIGKTLGHSDLLIEARDNGEDSGSMKMYGVVNDNASTIKDFVLYDEQGCALICIFGTISMDAVARLAAED